METFPLFEIIMDINNQVRHYSKAFPNQAANGVLGLPADLINTSSWSVAQSTASISLTLAIPSVTLAVTKLRLWVSNTGTVPVTIEGIVIPVKGEAQFYFEGTAWALTGFSAKSAFDPTFGTISDTVATGNTNAVANWGYLADGTPIPTDRVYYAETAGNINKTVSVANLKALLAAPDEIVDVSGATLPITYPVTTIPGVPVFTPNTPASTTAIYAITDGTSISYAKWNGTEFIGSAAPVAPADFFRSGAGTSLPDGVSDTSENVSRIGKTGFGTTDPSAVQATIDNFGTFTTRGTTIAFSGGINIISASVPLAQSAIMITQTVVDSDVSVGTPLGQTALGRYFRIHNDPASTNNLRFQNNVIKPGRFIDLQWNGTAWASEALYQPDGFPRSGSQSVGGIITAGATSYNDVDLSYNATITLPTAVGRRNEIFTINHLATADATLLGTNRIPATSLTLTPRNRVTRYISDGVVWRSIAENPVAYYHGTGYTLPVASPVTKFNDNVGSVISNGYLLPTTAQNYQVLDGNYTPKIVLPTGNNATGRFSVYVNNGAGFNTTISLQNTDLTSDYTIPSGQNNSMHFEWSDGLWRWCPSPEPKQFFGGNVTAMVSNAPGTTVMNVGGLFEISMPANTDVQIRALVARQVYISSEGEYPGGSFTTSTAAIVNLTTAFVPADNNVHVAGEMNIVRIQDVLTGRIFRVTVWRFGAIAGNWSGWVEEIGATTSQVLTAAAPIDLTNNQVNFTAPYFRGVGAINIGDFNTATVIAAESTAGITASIVSGSSTSLMVLQINLPVGMVPDASYKVLPVITSNATEAASANASVIFEIAAGRTATGFRVIFRETISVLQNCNFEFGILR